jgi:hypothetical protein
MFGHRSIFPRPVRRSGARQRPATGKPVMRPRRGGLFPP